MMTEGTVTMMIGDVPETDAAGYSLALAEKLLEELKRPPITRFTEVSGAATHLAIAVHRRWGAVIDLVSIDKKGAFSGQAADWVAPYIAMLDQAGISPAFIRVITQEQDLGPSQMISNLCGFGDMQRIKGLAPVLKACLLPDGALLTDIRKKSGAYPFLKPYGEVTQIGARDEDGDQIHRAVMRVSGNAVAKLKGKRKPVEAVVADVVDTPAPAQDWAKIATELAGKNGFYREDDEHAMLFIKRSDTLVVTFDNLDIAMEKREDKRPWGFAFIEKQGWSMLGVTAAGWTWFRDPWVYAQFDDLRKKRFFKRFKRVVFYGASMGGYGACAFAAACPGADVVAISPQSTLDKALVPFETRYKTAWDRDFSGKYGDAASVSRKAGSVTLIYDPYEPLDSAHANRFKAENVVKLRAPLLGHRLGSSLQQMGILSPIVLAALNGTLTEADFYQKLRKRKMFGRYQNELFNRAIDKGHPELARRMGRWVLTHGGNRHIRKAMESL
jgi:pimeloyl-ACP methyl ester carboxylesterase